VIHAELPRVSRRPSWLILTPLALVVVLMLGWTGIWFFATAQAERLMAGWQDREAQAGRIYGCATQKIGGYPFRFELACSDPSAEFRAAVPPLSLKAKNILAVTQIWNPTHIISEFTGPLLIAETGRAPTFAVTWLLAQTSLRGLPTAPERLAIVLDQPAFARSGEGGFADVVKAEHMELHARMVSGSASDHPVIEIAANAVRATAPVALRLAADPIDAEIVGTVQGLEDFAAKPIKQRLRELQAANGRLVISRARAQQGDVIASAAGSLGLTRRGALDGELRLTVVNLERMMARLGLDRMLEQLVPPSSMDKLSQSLDRLVPGLGGLARGATGNRGAGLAVAGITLLGGQPTELEGKSAISLPLRFADGDAFLGPLRIGSVPPLY
jgi:hypothetical protein